MGSPIESISSSKRALRESWKKSFPQDPDARKSASLAICQTLINHSGFIQAPQIGLFAARIFEIDLLPLLAMAQKPYFFPKVDFSTRQLHFFSITQLDQLEMGAYGILEPKKGLPKAQWSPQDLILVPGFGFDVFGIRIGSGAGYYDRFFESNPQLNRWGIGFHQQFHHQELAHSSHDVRMQAIVTESGFFPAKKVES
ncbi:5-formyltetrahydrofolate cyclo-ligase [bacterium]|nr:5-formyltetrahydrofolate cyclo-ligase [bacterium]